MSTLVSAALSSDDEDDQDFKLPQPKARHETRKRQRSDSASGSSSSDAEDEVDTVEIAEAQKLKADQEAVEAEERKARAREAFEAMKGQLSTIPDGARNPSANPAMVEVLRARSFAGETITETVTLPADHPEAIAYMKKTSKGVTPSDAPKEEAGTLQPSDNASAPYAGPSKPKLKPPARRKPRQSLESMSAALDKGKKMTTLEKSQMDWKKHTAGDRAIGDELEANRKAGGYLQKKDFLERVDERRMDTYESRQKPR